MIDLLTSIPALLGILGAVVAAFWGNGKLQRHKGRKQGRKDVSDELSEAYINKRQEIDNADLGHGATDLDRIKRLHDIANRQRGGGN